MIDSISPSLRSTVTVADKYTQPAVLDFWTRFAQQGLQTAEAAMLARYAAPPARLLDLGCGAGRVSLALTSQGYQVVGLDITAAMLAAARQLSAEQGVAGDFVQGDMLALPLAAGSFDAAVIFIAGLQHVQGRANRQQVLREIGRVLRAGGVLIVALDNVAPALRCYWEWAQARLVRAWRRDAAPGAVPSRIGQFSIRSPDLSRPRPVNESRQRRPQDRLPPAASPANTGSRADALLAAGRLSTGPLAWHARGLLRSLRWRTWEGIRDLGRGLGLVAGEPGDTAIEQVSMPPTPGRVPYHLYRHDELLADAGLAGFRLLGYHSTPELAEDKAVSEAARRLDKQVFYAWRWPGQVMP